MGLGRLESGDILTLFTRACWISSQACWISYATVRNCLHSLQVTTKKAWLCHGHKGQKGLACLVPHKPPLSWSILLPLS